MREGGGRGRRVAVKGTCTGYAYFVTLCIINIMTYFPPPSCVGQRW